MYDPTIPAYENIVEGPGGASGDLDKARQNFAHMEPVASGLSGSGGNLHGFSYGDTEERHRQGLSGETFAFERIQGGNPVPWLTTPRTGGDPRFHEPVSGETPTSSSHLATKGYTDAVSAEIVKDHGGLTGLGDDDHPHYSLADGTRPFTGPVSGQDPTEAEHLATRSYVDDAVSGVSGGGGGVTDHGALSGLADDDHPHYSLADGTRPFTGPVSGQDPTEAAHLATRSYVDDAVSGASGTTDHGALDGLADDDHPHYALADGTRPFTGAVSGQDPTEAEHLATKSYVDAAALSGVSGVTDHGELTGLADDDHPHYSLADGTRAFTGAVGGVTPTDPAHLTTKSYVDDAVSGGGGGVSDHGALSGLADDDHPHYALADGTRPFTGPVSGQDPTEAEHLATRSYVDDAVSGASGTTDHGALDGLADDDHPHYALADGTRPFTGAVSGQTPTQDAHLATKSYVDTGAASGEGLTESFGAIVENIASGDTLTLDLSAFYPYDLGRLFTRTASGDVELTLQIDSVDVTGLTDVLASTSKSEEEATGANSVAVAGELSLECVSGAASGLAFALETVRT